MPMKRAQSSSDIHAKIAMLSKRARPGVTDFQKLVLEFFRSHGRDFPWRKTRDPYEILVSEVMLQQTQTDRVVPKYEAFLREFPTVGALSEASVAEVVRMWMGLGYYRRALNLHKAAQTICAEHSGVFPTTVEGLRALPGVGAYTAAAVAAFAFGTPAPMIETNIRTVYLSVFFPRRRVVGDKEILQVVQETLYQKDARRWFYALMDLGVEIKRSAKGVNKRSRHYVKQSKFIGSQRQVRAAVLKSISEEPQKSGQILARLPYPSERIDKALVDLEREGFVVQNKRGTFSVVGS